MKKTQEIVGLPIITICDGMEAGRVKGLIINSGNGSVDYIVVDNGVQALSSGVIPTTQILGIGEYALTINNIDAIKNIGDIPEAVEYVQKDIKVKDTPILTKKGRMKGRTGDYLVDEDNACRIAGLEYIPGSGAGSVKIIPRESVITFGKQLVILQEDFEYRLLEAEEFMASVPETGSSEALNEALIDTVNEAVIEAAPALEEVISVEPDIFTPAETIQELPEQEIMEQQESSPANLFEQRQKQYLNGRKATKTIADNNGSIIVSEGATITDEIIDEAKNKGKLIELVMNNKA